VNLYIVETPLQLLCAFEAIRKVGDREHELWIRLNGKADNDRQTCNMAKLLNLNFKTFNFRKTARVIDGFFLLRLIPVLRRRYETVYLGSLFSSLLSVMSRVTRTKRIIYLDDGVATFLSSDRVLKAKSKQTIFTFFNIEPTSYLEVIQNDFNNLKEYFGVTKKISNMAVFIGQRVVDAGMMSEESYLSVIKRAQAEAQIPMTYIPHRDESSAVIEKISKIEGIDVVSIDVCIELYLLISNSNPSYIASSFSSALFSLGILFPQSRRDAWIPDCVNDQNIPHLEAIINGLEESGVRLIKY